MRLCNSPGSRHNNETHWEPYNEPLCHFYGYAVHKFSGASLFRHALTPPPQSHPRPLSPVKHATVQSEWKRGWGGGGSHMLQWCQRHTVTKRSLIWLPRQHWRQWREAWQPSNEAHTWKWAFPLCSRREHLNGENCFVKFFQLVKNFGIAFSKA